MSSSEKPEIRHAYEHHHLTSSRWDNFKTRAGDVIISTTYKAGTTWMQEIVGNIIFHEKGMEGLAGSYSPWIDMRLNDHAKALDLLENQTHKRFIKTHLPLDGLPWHDTVKYIMVGRDPRDVFMSLLNHWGSHTDRFFDAMNNHPDLVGPPFPRMGDDIPQIWRDWMTKGSFDWESDGYPYWSHLHHCKTWWEFRHLPNIEFFHYSDMLADLESEMRRVAKFIDVDVPEETWPRLVGACTFKSMRDKAIASDNPSRPQMFKGGAKTFFNKGTNGRWVEVLTDEQLRRARCRGTQSRCGRLARARFDPRPTLPPAVKMTTRPAM
jgi:aryl sulfotransferase